MEAVLETLSWPFMSVLNPGIRIYWVYLLVSLYLAIGTIVIRASISGQPTGEAFKEQLSSKIWWSASAKADYRYYIINTILYGMIIAPLVLASAEIGLWIETTTIDWFGPQQAPMFSTLPMRIAYTVCFFLAMDFGKFYAHLLLHISPFLWQFHKVHHSAETLNPLTTYRMHPVDLFLAGSFGNVCGGIVTGIFFYISAGEITIYSFLGTQLLLAIFNMVANLRHTHIWLDFGILDYIFISPAQHQIHHSALPRHYGKNCGFGMAIWDWMFGTLYVPAEREEFPMGLTPDQDPSWHKVSQFYWRPVVLIFGMLKRRYQKRFQ
ncbi:MAG: sterol desaturase family protein [Rhodospirillales bacterium]|jgi:sterol desaturase/sphingolipid hydroxylase (fatty acid hydroxylase superfamily)|nr:sterol desaturase family protein [Rhodospirillales bacterium]